jgi:hypothetical protein
VPIRWLAVMNALVRRALIAARFDEAVPLFEWYVDKRTVSLFGLVTVPGLERKLGATVRATLEASASKPPSCRVTWEPADLMPPAPTEFKGALWLEPDEHDERRSWLVLDGDYAWEADDRLMALVVRRLSAAIARDLLARVADFVEARRAEATSEPGPAGQVALY